MTVLVDKSSKIIIQGFTGKMGSFHADEMIKYGSNVVGGVTPGKGGLDHLAKPVFNTVSQAVLKTKANTSIIFVPALFALVVAAYSAGLNAFIAADGKYLSPVFLEGLPDLVLHFCFPQSFKLFCDALKAI